ncbi:hypothetical protein [Trichocoleus sp. FACHB-591]|nr:hypothetical protein [Trichocoleus sp. FACHB-591]
MTSFPKHPVLPFVQRSLPEIVIVPIEGGKEKELRRSARSQS